MTDLNSQQTIFKPGDIVQVKSGGPPMTAIALSPEGVHCLWYGELNDEVKTGILPAISLEIITILDDEEDEDDDEDDHKGKKQHGKKKRHGDD